MGRSFPVIAVVFAGVSLLQGLNTDEMKMLQDSGGWEYITMSRNEMNGFPTQHSCFDGRPHPGQCGGTLTLTPNKTFVQNMRIQGQTVRRNGTYELNGDQLAFIDELGTKDGPYTLVLNAQAKSLVLQMPQVRIEFLLESEYRKNMQEQRRRERAH
jgi:hypothetical protein